MNNKLLSMMSQLQSQPSIFGTILMPPKFEKAVREAVQDMHEFGLGALRITSSPYIEPICAVQIDPKFPWISAEGRKRINARFEATFGKTQDVAYMFDANAMRDFMYGWRDNIDKHCIKLMSGDL